MQTSFFHAAATLADILMLHIPTVPGCLTESLAPLVNQIGMAIVDKVLIIEKSSTRNTSPDM